MYHCHLRFYLIGDCTRAFNIIKEMPPQENFTHSFEQSDLPQEQKLAAADIVIAVLKGGNVAQTAKTIFEAKKENAELIILTERENIEPLWEYPAEITDIWTLPLSNGEIRFRFSHLQQKLKTQKDLWQSERFLEAGIDGSPNLVWYKDKNGIHEKVNSAFCHTVNKTKQQVEGQGHAYIWDVEEDDPACIESECIVMTEKRMLISEEQVSTGDGMRLMTTYKSPLYDIDGSVMGTVGVAVDTTKEHNYEKEIIRKNRTLETIFKTLECGVITHTLDGLRVVAVNPVALEILGYETKEELEADDFHTVASTVVEDDRASIRAAIDELKPDGKSISVDYRIRHKDGRLRYVMGAVKLIEENGELLCQRFLLDCTARKLAEEKSNRRQNQLIRALSIDYNQVCYYDLETGAGFPLRTHVCRYGVVTDMFSGKNPIHNELEKYISFCVSEDDRELMRKALSPDNLKEKLRDKRIYTENYKTNCAGHIHYFQMKAVRAGDWNEAHDVVIGFRNVDDETRIEIEKRNKLEDALAKAKQASNAKTVFLSNMSHDIRTPMNAILGFTALGIKHIDKKELVGEYLNKIMSSGNHLLNLVNDVLDMSRIENGKITIDETPCTLPDILHGLCNIIYADVHSKNLEFTMEAIDIVHENIFLDKLRFNQALLNLLSNSVKYTGEGGKVSVRVTEKSGAPQGFAEYEFYIRDTGIGMSPEFVEHIFEPFERERSSTISGIPGTGLGMTIAKNIIDMMNGSIEVRSEKGAGTEFIVNFAFRLSEDEEEQKSIAELEGLKALAVDGNVKTCKNAADMLNHIGLRADWTPLGEEAELLADKAVESGERYEVYLIDCVLPDMSGVELARRLIDKNSAKAPIIILMDYDCINIDEEAKKSGVNAFCAKPLFLSELREHLYCALHSVEDDVNEPVFKRSGRILLAEDNAMNREIAEAILSEAGFEIDSAENGKIALDMLAEAGPGYYKLVLMDVQMPVMDGYETTRAIRALENPKLSSIPVIAMTANAFEEDKKEAAKNGMNAHIAKPIDVKVLFNTLDSMMK